MTVPMTAISNLKGGVGKSTTTVMLADGLAYYYGAEVLVVDLDPQANVSQMLLTEEGLNRAFEQEKGTYHLLTKFIAGSRPNVADLILPNAVTLSELKKADAKDRRAGWISIIPSHPVIRMKELELEETAYSGNLTPSTLTDALCEHIRAGIAPLLSFYDYVLFDSPPYLSPLARAMLKITSNYIVPTTSDYVSVWGTKQFSEWLMNNVDPQVAENSFVLITRFKNTKHGRAAERELRDIYLKGRTFGPTIPESINVLTGMERGNVDSYRTLRSKYGNLTPDIKRLAEHFARFTADRKGTDTPSMIRR